MKLKVGKIYPLNKYERKVREIAITSSGPALDLIKKIEELDLFHERFSYGEIIAALNKIHHNAIIKEDILLRRKTKELEELVEKEIEKVKKLEEKLGDKDLREKLLREIEGEIERTEEGKTPKEKVERVLFRVGLMKIHEEMVKEAEGKNKYLKRINEMQEEYGLKDFMQDCTRTGIRFSNAKIKYGLRAVAEYESKRASVKIEICDCAKLTTFIVKTENNENGRKILEGLNKLFRQKPNMIYVNIYDESTLICEYRLGELTYDFEIESLKKSKTKKVIDINYFAGY